MEKLTSIEPKMTVPVDAKTVKEEIIKEMDAINEDEVWF